MANFNTLVKKTVIPVVFIWLVLFSPPTVQGQGGHTFSKLTVQMIMQCLLQPNFLGCWPGNRQQQYWYFNLSTGQCELYTYRGCRSPNWHSDKNTCERFCQTVALSWLRPPMQNELEQEIGEFGEVGNGYNNYGGGQFGGSQFIPQAWQYYSSGQNTGNQGNTGTGTSGNLNNQNTGNQNTGTQNTGTQNTGTQNTGTQNTGTQNTGTQNTGNQNTGIGTNTGTQGGTVNTGTQQQTTNQNTGGTNQNCINCKDQALGFSQQQITTLTNQGNCC